MSNIMMGDRESSDSSFDLKGCKVTAWKRGLNKADVCAENHIRLGGLPEY